MDAAERLQAKIALATLRMSDFGARVMGGMTKEEALSFLRMHGLIVECGSCGFYHPRGYDGDCRDDRNRFFARDS